MNSEEIFQFEIHAISLIFANPSGHFPFRRLPDHPMQKHDVDVWQ